MIFLPATMSYVSDIITIFRFFLIFVLSCIWYKEFLLFLFAKCQNSDVHATRVMPPVWLQEPTKVLETKLNLKISFHQSYMDDLSLCLIVLNLRYKIDHAYQNYRSSSSFIVKFLPVGSQVRTLGLNETSIRYRFIRSKSFQRVS